MCLLLLLSSTVVFEARRTALQEVAWPDECIYLVGARNLVERGTLDTNFYLTYSLLRRGHPHRDVHMPGYVLALSPFVAALGPTLEAAAALNAVLFAACTLLVYAIARAVLEGPAPALTAAALFTVLPPYPGYLFVAYSEIAVAFALLAGVAWSLWARGTFGAAVAGALWAGGALLRETLLLSAPIVVSRFDRRQILRGFVPAAAAVLVLVVAPLSKGRAVHPNALYPSVLEEAAASGRPLATLAAAVAGNVASNLHQTAAADPAAKAEDAVLLFDVVLFGAAAACLRRQTPAGRRFAIQTFASLLLLTGAVLTLYVVRERGGVWGGVRAYMAWTPLLLVAATPLLFALRSHVAAAVLALAVGGGMIGLDRWQVRFFNRYKGTDLEDQKRNADYLSRYLDRHRPTRILSRSFLYGYTHYPVEVIWSLPRDGRELAALNAAVPYEFLSIHEKSALRHLLMGNPRFLRVNKDDRGAEFLVWRRLY